MSNENRIKTLRRLIGTLKSKLTRAEKFLQKPIDSLDLLELKAKLADLNLVKTNFDEKQTEMDLLVPDNEIDKEYKIRGDFEDKFSALCAKAQGLINIKTPIITNQLNVQSNSRDTVSENIPQIMTPGSSFMHPINEQVINVKLPALNLPSFSGSYEKWPGFSDVFKSSVHKEKRYTDAQKLVYLRSCLSDKAADKIESLETTDANYQVAWKILEKYYDDPTLVINNHIKSFFELPNCHNASASSLGDLLNNVTKHRALEALNRPFLQAFPIYAVTLKLDPQTRLKWKEHMQSNNNPTMEELLEFLHCREKVLEVNKVGNKHDKQEKNLPRKDNNPQRNCNRPNQQSNANRVASYHTTHKPPFCNVCKESHFTKSCEKLVNVNLAKHLEIVKNLNLCTNCLRSNHTVENCKSVLCKTCNKKHHTLLHEDDKKKAQVNFASLHNVASSQILLSTAMIHILDRKGNPHTCRALLNNGSQVHFITEKMAAKLKLKQFDREIPLGGVNQMSSCISKITSATIESRLNKYSTNLTFLISQSINEYTPSESINRTALKFPPNIRLADPEFHIPGSIDILIGAEIFLKLLCVGQISLVNNSVTLQKTHLGWILGGKIPGLEISKAVTCNLSLNLLHNQISKFWEIENVPNENVLSNEEMN
ncbi:uncharacterized protein LOC127278879 [Leptopilina boulardi]|uniref:uncharacterized protein LOC127278879 n=1 Tax=Leptopilina boulardi TaxID=63433 RepID=UPI0021F651FE|nr:uncharacterized protein LOC127278879 [Leptopilina boulardi]